MTTWMQVTDRGRARLFRRALDQEHWSDVESFGFLEERSQLGETQTSRLPTDTAGKGQRAPEPHTGFHDTTAAAFSPELVDDLERDMLEKRFDILWVVAPPLFLVERRDHLPQTLKPLVRRQWRKYLAKQPDLMIQADIEGLGEHDEAR